MLVLTTVMVSSSNIMHSIVGMSVYEKGHHGCVGIVK